MIRCYACGQSGADSDRFCGACGARLAPTAPSYAPPPTVAATATDRTAVILVVVLVGLVSVVAVAILYVMASGLTTHPPVPSFGVTVSRSLDGLEWVLTFTSVPQGFTQNGTSVSLLTASGTWLLTPTTLYQLEGNGQAGVRYVPKATGVSYTACAPGDRIFMASGTGTNQYPAGTMVHIIGAGTILYSGTLQ